MSLSVEQIAAICHEMNRLYCEAIGDPSQRPWAGAPEWQRATVITGVENIADGVVTRPEQSHEAWLAEKGRTGWRYGPLKDPEKKEHPNFVPFARLPREQQLKDHLFFAVASLLLGDRLLGQEDY